MFKDIIQAKNCFEVFGSPSVNQQHYQPVISYAVLWGRKQRFSCQGVVPVPTFLGFTKCQHPRICKIAHTNVTYQSYWQRSLSTHMLPCMSNALRSLMVCFQTYPCRTEMCVVHQCTLLSAVISYLLLTFCTHNSLLISYCVKVNILKTD